MVDLRAALRPLVENPPEEPRSVDDIANRAARGRRQRARRRSALLALSVVALLVLVNSGRFWESPGGVTEVAPSQAGSAGATATEPSDDTDPAGTTPGTPKEPAATTSTAPAATEASTTIPAPTDSPAPPPPEGSHGPFSGLEAEHYDSQRGVEVTTMPGGGHGITVGDGGHVAFHQVDFGDSLATRLEARIAPPGRSAVDGIIEVRLHAEDSPPFGTLKVSDATAVAGSDGEPVTISADIPAIGGRGTVYVTFTSSHGGDFALVDWFRFRR